MESTPKTKPIKIKCDPSKSDSAWKWLERWVSVSPTVVEQSLKPELSAKLDEPEKDKCPENQVDNDIPSTDYCESRDLLSTTEEATMPSLDSSMGEAAVPSESEVNSLTQKSKSESFGIQPHFEITAMSNPRENSDFPPTEASQSDFIPQVELNSLSAKPELEMEQTNCSMKRNASEQPETEGRKLVLGSRKASNPAFIAAQSKFEELTSATNPAKSVNSSNQDLGIESCAADTVSSATDNAIKTKEIDLAENSVPYNSRIQLGGSESGTELSISSTLDSPVRSEPLAVEYKQQSNVLEEETKSNKNVDIEAKVDPTIPNIDLSCPISDQPEKFDNVNASDGEPFNFVLVGDSSQVDQKLEENASMQTEIGSETVHQVCKSSTPEASPRSHMTTLPESQGTPSSQVSSKAKKNTRSDKNGSKQKRKSLSAGKRSPIKPNHDSGARSSLEKLPKEQHKTGKQQSSSEHLEEEPRDSSSSNSLPSYMQATESARAKTQACSSSPRSSPDVTEKDIYVKKRHSLPGANGRHGSPRIQRSMSQAQQSRKGSSTHPSQGNF